MDLPSDLPLALQNEQNPGIAASLWPVLAVLAVLAVLCPFPNAASDMVGPDSQSAVQLAVPLLAAAGGETLLKTLDRLRSSTPPLGLHQHDC